LLAVSLLGFTLVAPSPARAKARPHLAISEVDWELNGDDATREYWEVANLGTVPWAPNNYWLLRLAAAVGPVPEAPPGSLPPRRMTAMVLMRDGTRLATDVILPPGRGPWPAVLQRTPYGKTAVRGDRFVQHGLAVVVQDMRGTGNSDGTWRLMLDDGWGRLQDGADTVAWIRRQPWCDGKVATAGMPIPQMLLAGAGPEGLAGQHANIAPLSLYHHAFYQSGVYRPEWDQIGGPRGWPMALLWHHPSYGDFWRTMDLRTRLDRVRWPGVYTAGWFNYFCQGTIDAFREIQTRGGPGARGRQHLVIGLGPFNPETRQCGELTFPEIAARPPGAPDVLQWLRLWLKGEPTVQPGEPAVRYFVMGDVGDPRAPGNTWRAADRWPPPSHPHRLYFTAEGGLTPERPATAAARDYDYDPARPVPSLGGQILAVPPSGLRAGPCDQRPVESRPDVLVFTSPPLEAPLEVTGRLTVRLHAATSARDTDFTAKLCDVYPDGRSMLVADGIVRARYRRSLEKPEPVTPGKRYAYDIDLWSTSLIFNRGHRLRGSISSSNAPRFEPNPNTWPEEGAAPKVAHQTVSLGGGSASHVVLPVIERSSE
jgi:putative CocE/NonD family hydrolase